MKNKILFGGICAVIAGCIGMSDVYGKITVIGEIEVPKGLKGDKGDTGEKGDKGDTGAKGEPGVNGKDGADGKSFCDSLTTAQQATTIASSTDWAYVNQNDSTGAVGYKTRTNTMCNGTTKPEVINDECVVVSGEDMDCATGTVPVECVRQIVSTGATKGYNMCKKLELSTSKSITAAVKGLKDDMTTELNKKANASALENYATTDSVTASINAVTNTVNTLSSNLDTAQGKLNTLEGKLSCAGFGKHDITGTDDCPTGYVCTQMLCCETTGDLTNGKCEWKN